MNAARRARRKQRELLEGGHTAASHKPGVRCDICKPPQRLPDDPELIITAADVVYAPTRRQGGLRTRLQLPDSSSSQHGTAD